MTPGEWLSNEARANLWDTDPRDKRFSTVCVEGHPGRHWRPYSVVVCIGKREDAMELQAKIQEWLGTKSS